MVKNEITKIELIPKATDKEYVRVTIEPLDSSDENIIIISNKILSILQEGYLDVEIKRYVK